MYDQMYDQERGILQGLSATAQMAGELGEPAFHVRMLEVLGSILPHEMSWIVRYQPEAAPEVLYTAEICSSIVDYYLEAEPRISDPYLCSWVGNGRPRVETMENALPLAKNRNFYMSDFRKRVGLTDELAIYLPASGASCLSIFLDRRAGKFSEGDVAQLNQIFPSLLELHKAHLRALFNKMSLIVAGSPSFESSVAAIYDRLGGMVYCTERWRQTTSIEVPLFGVGGFVEISKLEELSVASELTIEIVELDAMHSIAPGGRLVFLSREAERVDQAFERNAGEVLRQLTPRERDIMALTLDGLSTGHIAQRLGIAKGSIKNARLRMYRKLGVCSEREMMSKLMPFSKELREKL